MCPAHLLFFSSCLSASSLHSSQIAFPLIPEHSSRNLVELQVFTHRGVRRYARHFTPPRVQLCEPLADHDEDGARSFPRVRLQCPLPPFLKPLPQLHASFRRLCKPELDPASTRTVSHPTPPEHKQRIFLALQQTASLWPNPFSIRSSTTIQRKPRIPTLCPPTTIYTAAFGLDVYVCRWICEWWYWIACV